MIPNKIIDISDEGLIRSIKNKDGLAFKEVFKRYWQKLYIYAFNVLRDKDLCEDIIQEVFTDLWMRKDRSDITNLSAYLYKAVKFQIFKQFRQKKLIINHSEQFDDFMSEHRVDELIEYKELQNRVENLISELPEQRRIIFQLSRNEELSNKEIASKLNISLQTVKNQITTALKSIRKSIKILTTLFI
ncbi:MAG: RNA polymerase sigma-70 factor [Melioribacter sp.]|nr:RNA polymerase sigma-70 factor [Melioribacter sp.]